MDRGGPVGTEGVSELGGKGCGVVGNGNGNVGLVG
jgi:hypothetical protein